MEFMISAMIQDICKETGRVTAQSIEEIKQRHRLMGGGLDTAIFELSLMGEQDMIQKLSQRLAIKAWSEYQEVFLDLDVSKKLNPELARSLRVVCPYESDDCVMVVTKDLISPETKTQIERLYHKDARLFLCSEMRFEVMYARIYDQALSPRFLQLAKKYALNINACTLSAEELGGEFNAMRDELALPPKWDEILAMNFEDSSRGKKADYDSKRSRELDRAFSAFSQVSTLPDMLAIAGSYAQNHASAQWWGECKNGALKLARIMFNGGILKLGRSYEHVIEPCGEIVCVCSGHSYYSGAPNTEEFAELYDTLEMRPPQSILLLPIRRNAESPFLWLWENPKRCDETYLKELFALIESFSQRLDALKNSRDSGKFTSSLNYKSSLFANTKAPSAKLNSINFAAKVQSELTLQDTIVPGLNKDNVYSMELTKINTKRP